MTKFIFYLLFFSIAFGQSKNQNFEFTGIDQFWKIVKTLEANLEPSQNDWNKLFNTPGYRVLTNHEFKKEFFVENFKLVFKPNRKKDLEKALKSGKNIQYLNHYIKVRDNANLISDQLKVLKRNPFNRKAIKRTVEYLPQYSVSNFPPVSFVIFESNGRGSSPIVVDLAATIEWDFISFLSHEYHHWYRNRQLKIRLHSIQPEDRDIVNSLSLIEAEGIADMVDKKDWFYKPNSAVSEYARRYIRDVRRTPYVIKSMDRLFSQIAENITDKRTLSRKLPGLLPERGHTTGYYMAQVILEIENKRKLVNCVGNPFEFILLYNSAARKSGGKYPVFSKNSIYLIESLNNKYKI